VSKKSPKIAALIAEVVANSPASKWDVHYLAYFECFNRGMYYEAHDVLEELWLLKKGDSIFLFYKGLIQLAGAFVHLTKSKLNPAARLFRLAKKNLELYKPLFEDFDVGEVLERINRWISELEESDYKKNPYDPKNPPKLILKI
jgi:predicted metal-dependent hydrolase